jgi:hypothetical protein
MYSCKPTFRFPGNFSLALLPGITISSLIHAIPEPGMTNATGSSITDGKDHGIVMGKAGSPDPKTPHLFRNRITGGSLIVHRKHYQGVRSPL